MTSGDKEKEKKGGLIYAIALNPLDPAHLIHNGCDKGLERFHVSIQRQGLEDVGEVEAWVAEGHFHQHLLQDFGTDGARLVSQLLWNPFPELLESRHHAFEEQAELGTGLEMLVGGISKILHPQLRQLPVDGSGSIHKTLKASWAAAAFASSASSALIFSDKATSRSLAPSSV